MRRLNLEAEARPLAGPHGASFAIADQAVLSLGRLAVVLVLARVLPAEQYGVFVVSYGVVLLFQVLQFGWGQAQ